MNTHAKETILFSEIFTALWKRRVFIIGSSLLCTLFASLIAMNLSNKYASYATLAPVEQEAGGGLSGLASQFGGLASIAGINIGGNQSHKFTLAKELLQSKNFIISFIEKHELKIEVMAIESWDHTENKYVYDNDVFDEERAVWVRKENFPKMPEPSLLEAAQEFLNKNLIVKEDKDSGYLKLGIEHFSPYFSKRVLELLIFEANNEIKNQDLTEAERSIQYLTESISTTYNTEMQSLLYNLIEQQQQIKMLALVKHEYILQTVDKPLLELERVSPNRLVIVVLGGFFGALFACLIIVLGLNFMGNRNEQ